jgi:hypothetical protein
MHYRFIQNRILSRLEGTIIAMGGAFSDDIFRAITPTVAVLSRAACTISTVATVAIV